AAGPFALDGHAAFERKPELGEQLDGGIEVFDNDPHAVHTIDGQAASLSPDAASCNRAPDGPRPVAPAVAWAGACWLARRPAAPRSSRGPGRPARPGPGTAGRGRAR